MGKRGIHKSSLFKQSRVKKDAAVARAVGTKRNEQVRQELH